MKKKQQPEKLTEHMTFTVTPTMRALIDREAQIKGVQPSSIVRMALSAWLAWTAKS